MLRRTKILSVIMVIAVFIATCGPNLPSSSPEHSPTWRHKVIGRHASEILLLGPRRTSHALDGLFGPPFFQCRQAFRVEPCAGVFRHHAKDHLGR
jgi:hypothetical protein